MIKGVVIKSTGSRYKVLTATGQTFECTIKGKFRVRELSTTNPVAVGDYVMISPETGTSTAVITELLDRKNYILRKSSNLSKQSQIIAANIDQAFLMVTIILPETPVEFTDRFLITAEAYRVPATILFNKTDLYGEEEMRKMENLIGIYENAGYRSLRLSLETGAGLGDLVEMMRDRTTLVAGNSGVGKTTLLNRLDPSLKLRTKEISDYHKQGKHVTTFPEMYHMPFGGYVIDTPGIRGFGVVNMEKNEIYHFFPEIFRTSGNCRFHNCLHLDEPGCAVREAVENGEIDLLRYRSYLSIIEDDDSKYR